MHDARQARGGGDVANHVNIVVGLQERGRNLVGNRAFHRVSDDFSLFLAPSREENLASGQNRGHTHRNRARRNGFAAAETARHFLARSSVDEDDARRRIERRTRLVGGDVAHSTDAEQHHVDAAETLDALFVEATVLLHLVLLDGSVGRKDILAVNIDVVEESLVQLSNGTLLSVFRQREIFVGVENNDILETHALFLVQSDEFLIDGRQRSACAQSEHAIFSLATLLLHFFDNRQSHFPHAVLGLRIDVGRQLLHSRDFAAIYSGERTVKLLWYFIQYDL